MSDNDMDLIHLATVDGVWGSKRRRKLRMSSSLGEVAARAQLKKYGEYLAHFQASLASLEAEAGLAGGGGVWVDAAPELGLDGLRDGGWRSGNSLLDKALLALSGVCGEARSLATEASSRLLPPLLVYGEEAEAPLLAIAHALPLLQELCQWLLRLYAVVRNMLAQAAALCGPGKERLLSVDGRPSLAPLWATLGALLGSSLTLDEALRQHPLIGDHWGSYLKTVSLVQNNPGKFGLAASELRPLERQVLARIDAMLMPPGRGTKNCLEQPFALSGPALASLGEELSAALARQVETWDRRFESGWNNGCGLLGLCGLAALHHAAFPAQREKKATKMLWEVIKKCPIVPLGGDLLFAPAKWLHENVRVLPEIVDRKSIPTAIASVRAHVLSRAQLMAREVDSIPNTVCDWQRRIVSALNVTSTEVNSDLERRATLFIQGLRLGRRLCESCAATLNWHSESGTPIPRRQATAVFRLVHQVVVIQETLESLWLASRSASLVDTLGHCLQKWAAELIRFVLIGKSALKSGKHLDALSALIVAQHSLSGPLTKAHIELFKMSIHIGNLQKLLKGDDWGLLCATLDRLEEVHSALSNPRLVDASFLLFHRSLLPLLCQTSLAEPGWAPVLKSVLRCVSDSGWLLDASRHAESAEDVRRGCRLHLNEMIQEHLVVPLCAAVEVDLRLATHGHLQLDERNPFKTPASIGVDLRPFFRLPPLRVLGQYVHIKVAVETYLRRTFYNLAAVTLGDWATYAEMAGLAGDKFGLDLEPPKLPAHTLDHGLDLLEIMRNLHVFVAKYVYNLNTQTFVERNSKDRHLNTLGLPHVANSIRTHGTGIMNTTVNFTYQFLRKKFYVFSQFLFDDQIKSRLQKDARFFRDNKEALDGRYPVEKAEKFNRNIRKLGLGPDGVSYLDQFRRLITEIGNALGYVRLVRSAGAAVTAESAQFLPDLEDVVSLAPLVASVESLGPTSLAAAELLDGLVQDILTSTDIDYFKLLVDAFAGQFRNPSHVHLAQFYVIVPPLVVNYAEHIVAAKERLGRRTPADGDPGAFTDDGFPMGIAYILRLLDQYEEFDSLQWFASLDRKFRTEKAEMVEKQRTSGEEKLGQTLALSLKRLNTYQREVELVRFGLRSARIFFRGATAEAIAEPDKSDAQSLAGSTTSTARNNE